MLVGGFSGEGNEVAGIEFCWSRKLSVAWCRLVEGFVTLVGCKGSRTIHPGGGFSGTVG